MSAEEYKIWCMNPKEKKEYLKLKAKEEKEKAQREKEAEKEKQALVEKEAKKYSDTIPERYKPDLTEVIESEDSKKKSYMMKDDEGNLQVKHRT